jgi:hypothetical protein
MKHSAFFPFAVLVLALAACAPQPTEKGRVFEREGGFSYVPPVSWKVQSSKSFKYQVVLGPGNNGFAANVNFQIEENNAPFKLYLEASKTSIPKFFPSAVLKSINPFEIRSGSDAAKIDWEVNLNQRNLHINSYAIDGKALKFVITCTRLTTQPAAIDLECDQTARSFRIE